MTTALGQTHLQFSNSSGLLQVVASSTDNVTVNSASTTTTVTGLTSGSAQLPLFTDAGSPYTGAITGSGSEMTGLAERIEVNPALLANPAGPVGLQHQPADRGRRHHAPQFPVFATDLRHVHLFDPNRPWVEDRPHSRARSAIIYSSF